MYCYTDYPLTEDDWVGSEPVQRMKLANIRAYDGDKYCIVYYKGEFYEIKAGYLYIDKRGSPLGDIIRDFIIDGDKYRTLQEKCVN